MSCYGHLEPAAGVKAYDRSEREVQLETLRGRRIKNVYPKQDGSVVVIIDRGAGVAGLPVLFRNGQDYEACRRRNNEPLADVRPGIGVEASDTCP